MSRLTPLFAVLLLAGTAGWLPAAEIVIVNNNGPGEGLNDPEPRSPVGGNDGETLGEQRMIVLEAAAALWADQFDLSVELRVGSVFDDLDCQPTSAVLGSAGPNFTVRDFPEAPEANTWYTVAQADTLRGTSVIQPSQQHIGMTLNILLDDGDPDCLGGNAWYYGLDGNTPSGSVALFPVVLHELAHGLGFLTLVDLETGELSDGRNDAYMLFLRDNQTGKQWTDMDDTERAASTLNDPRVVWTGPNVAVQSDFVTAGAAFDGGFLRVHAPDELEPGSSISHFTPAATPNLLMEPSLNASLFDQLDLTPALFRDIGWPVTAVMNEIFQDRFEQ